MVECGKELREAVAQENKRIRDQDAEEKRERKEEKERKREENIKIAIQMEAKKAEALKKTDEVSVDISYDAVIEKN